MPFKPKKVPTFIKFQYKQFQLFLVQKKNVQYNVSKVAGNVMKEMCFFFFNSHFHFIFNQWLNQTRASPGIKLWCPTISTEGQLSYVTYLTLLQLVQ